MFSILLLVLPFVTISHFAMSVLHKAFELTKVTYWSLL